MPRIRRFSPAGTEPIGQRLSRLRKEHGITQAEIARKLGIPQSLVSNYERGRFRLNAEILVEFARILGVTTDQILGLDQSQEAGRRISPRRRRMLEEIDLLPRGDRQALFRIIDAFLIGRRPTSGQSPRATSTKTPSRHEAKA